MRTKLMFLALVLLPATVLAQASAQASSTANSKASAQSKQATATANEKLSGRVSFEAPHDWSAEGKAKLEAMFKEAQDKDVPREPIAQRVAEGRTKGASEATILANCDKVRVNLESSHEAMVRAGRKPTLKETSEGANAMERGVTDTQLEGMAKHTPSDRSLVVALDVLTQLAARGVPVDNALTQIQGKIDARATDTQIRGLLSFSANAGTRGH